MMSAPAHTVTRVHIPSRDPRLKRHIHHDSRSRHFAFNTSHLKAGGIVSVIHPRHIPILDQGQVGSCTGNAGIGALATDPLYTPSVASQPVYPLNESGALKLYSAAETIDGDGPYPPNDNGSCGLSIAKALLAAGLISSYQHTFTLNDALLAVQEYPIICGVNWYDGMFTPAADGRVQISGQVAGGHEILCRQVDAQNKRVWFDNSWGSSWGVQGRFYMTFDDFSTLLSQQGDVVVLISNNVNPPNPAPPQPSPPAPTPSPPAPPSAADTALAAVTHQWLVLSSTQQRQPIHLSALAAALKQWLQATGL